jgi:putative membrane protein
MQKRTPSPGAGLVAGFLAGLAGSAAKAAAEVVYPPRTAGQTPPPIVLVRKIAGHRLDRRSEARVMKCIHYGFGAVVGAAYGCLVEYYPRVTAGKGAIFGTTLNVMTHETALPLLGLSDSPLKQKSRERASEAATHVVFGVALELTRDLLRSNLSRKDRNFIRPETL